MGAPASSVGSRPVFRGGKPDAAFRLPACAKGAASRGFAQVSKSLAAGETGGCVSLGMQPRPLLPNFDWGVDMVFKGVLGVGMVGLLGLAAPVAAQAFAVGITPF